MTKSFFILLLFLSTVKVASGCCSEDDRTLTELLYKANTGTIFACKILTSYTDKNEDMMSTARVLRVYLGSVDTSDIVINSGNSNSSTGGWSLKVGGTYLFFHSGTGSYFGCCSICDRWTRQISDVPDSSDEVQVIEQFADIFKSKSTGNFIFKMKNGTVIGEGGYKDGIACGEWKHFYGNGKIKTEIDLETSSYTKYFQNGFIDIRITYQKNDTVFERYSERYGLIVQKELDSLTSSGKSIKTSFEYYDNGILKEMHRLFNREGTGASINYFEEYYPNGNLHLRGQNQGAKRIELWEWYAPNGSLYTQYDYKDGNGNQ